MLVDASLHELTATRYFSSAWHLESFKPLETNKSLIEVVFNSILEDTKVYSIRVTFKIMWRKWLTDWLHVLIPPYLLNNAVDDLNKTAPLSTCLQQTAGTHSPLKGKNNWIRILQGHYHEYHFESQNSKFRHFFIDGNLNTMV